MAEKHTLSAAAAQFTVACNLSTLYIMLAVREDVPTWGFPVALLLYAPLLYGLNRLFLRRERRLQSLCILNVVTGLLFVALCCWADGLSGLLYRLPIMVVFTIWITFKSINSALDGPTLSGMLLCLDGSILTLVLFSVYYVISGQALMWNIPIICSFAASILGTTAQRSNRAFGWKEWTFMAVAFGLIFAVMWLLMGLVAAPAGSGLVMLWNTLVQIASFAGGLLLRFLQFLSSLFPASQEGGELLAPDTPAITPELEAGEVNPIFGMVIIVLFLAFAVFCIILLIRKLGGKHVGGRAAKTKSAHQRTRPSLRQALGRLLAEWKRRLLLQKFLWSHRNTAVGLYFILVRRCRITPWHALPGETPREFLSRLRHGVRNDTLLSDLIAQLIPAVDAALYGGAPVSQSFPQAPLIRQKIKSALPRQILQNGLRPLKAEPPAP